jgi:hypothetical protein
MESIQYENIRGLEWIPRFLRRHLEFSSVILRSIESVTLEEASPERLRQHFEDLEGVIVEYMG